MGLLSGILEVLELLNPGQNASPTSASSSSLSQGIPPSACAHCPPTPPSLSSTRRQGTSAGLVYACNSASRRLGALLGKGGEGCVYTLEGNSDVLVKLYHTKVLNGHRGATTRAKLEAMLANDAMKRNKCFGWPRVLVYDHYGEWIGYAMRRVAGHQMQTLCQPLLIHERLPHWSRQEVIECALSFLRLVRDAHEQEIILGDINPANFLIDPQDCSVSAIDCDSYQFRSRSGVFPCPVAVPMLIAPELLGEDFSRVERTTEQELFSVAVMLFRMFMLGLHPYSRTYGADPVANLESGQCPLGIGSGYRMPEGPWYNIWSHLPSYVKDLFIRAFRDGHSSPAERPTLDEWGQTLARYHADMEKGWFEMTLIPSTPKSSEYRGKNPVHSAPQGSHPAGNTKKTEKKDAGRSEKRARTPFTIPRRQTARV